MQHPEAIGQRHNRGLTGPYRQSASRNMVSVARGGDGRRQSGDRAVPTSFRFRILSGFVQRGLRIRQPVTGVCKFRRGGPDGIVDAGARFDQLAQATDR
jgi:hypothetical protein